MATNLYRHLDTNGDGSGDVNANGDYSAVAKRFYIQPPAGERFDIYRVVGMIEDTQGFRAENYGHLPDPLENGIIIRVQDDDGTKVDITDGRPIKRNADWGSRCYDVDLKTWGVGNEYLVFRWTFERCGSPEFLNGDLNERLEMVFNDDLRGLVEHHFVAEGQKV